MSDMPTVPPSYTPPPPPPPGGSYTPPPPPPIGGAPSSDRTLMLVLSYLGILALIPLIVKKDDREVQWHAKNGLGLAIAWFVLWIGVAIVEHFLPSVVSCGLALIHCVLALGFLVVIIMAIMKALKGERMRFPVISDFADKN